MGSPIFSSTLRTGRYMSRRVFRNDLSTKCTLSAFLSYIFGTAKHDIIPLTDKVLQQYVGKYATSYGRYLTISQIDKALKVTGSGMPTLKIFPETEHTFYPKEFEYQFEFINSDSLNIIIDGKIENIAKKIK